MLEDDFEKKLRTWLTGAERVVIAGIGNPIRMDDAVGVRIIQYLRGKVSSKVFLIECETVPESYIDKIEAFNPTHILLVDAALLGLNPGESKFVELSVLHFYPAFSTHMLPLRIFCEYLTKTTGAKIGLLLIQPKITDFGEELSPEVSSACEKITNLLSSILP